MPSTWSAAATARRTDAERTEVHRRGGVPPRAARRAGGGRLQGGQLGRHDRERVLQPGGALPPAGLGRSARRDQRVPHAAVPADLRVALRPRRRELRPPVRADLPRGAGRGGDAVGGAGGPGRPRGPEPPQPGGDHSKDPGLRGRLPLAPHRAQGGWTRPPSTRGAAATARRTDAERKCYAVARQHEIGRPSDADDVALRSY